MREIRAVLFDSDGTLVDSEVPAMDVLHQMAVAEGLQFTREEAHRQFRGVRMSRIAAWIAERVPQAGDNFEHDFTQRYREASVRRFKEDLAPMPGALELLQRLHIPFGVVTNGPMEKVQLTLDLTGLLPYVGDRIYSAYDHGCFKPDPALFLIAARDLGTDPAHCAVVEDSVPGLLAGVAAGMRVFSLHPREGVPEAIADKITYIGGLSELIDHL
ncbi:HAD-IA family hydrolase [uncultured Propionivibrio sp.]|uniref:HAD family hydrolase n=1 Tax=uncultured Propionivibrio sp. TaxID=426737 RepID=UPI0029C00AF0|nr:HAD-IA family hydrolase [uncultured Propionivibrio sp.]